MIYIKLSGPIELFGQKRGPVFTFNTEQSARDFCDNLGLSFHAVILREGGEKEVAEQRLSR